MDENKGLTRRDLLGSSLLVGASVSLLAMQAEGQAGGPRSVDLLINGPDVVSFDEAGTVVSDGAIAIQGNSIQWIGKAADAAKLVTAKETISASGLIAMPGLTDTHYHTAQQFLRGVQRTTHLRGPHWKRYLIPFESGLEPEDVYHSGIVGYTSMISAGITCFLEAGGPNPDEMGRAADEVGIRGRIAQNTCDMDNDLPKTHLWSTDKILKESEALVKRWEKHPRVNAWLSLRQIIVNTEPLRIEISKMAQQLDTGIHTHLCEGTYEVDFAVENYNLRPPEYFEKIGIFNDRMHCAHSILLTPDDLDLYAKYDVSAAHCAFNNYNLAPHRFYDMVRKNIRVGLGTDGPGSRGTLDLFQVAHYAVLGQTIGYGMPFHASAPVSYEEMLKYAVRNGARAARLGSRTGSLEVGKLADIVLVSRDDYDQYPSTDPLITLGQNTIGHHVRTVVIDGRVVMKDRQFLTVDMERLRQRMNERYPILLDRFDKAIA
ncbi:MAG: amidohydrolase family protein [Bryobacterales bacterium]|nr:amidohydrolase family protein [Bryobacterales bacterium]